MISYKIESDENTSCPENTATVLSLGISHIRTVLSSDAERI